MNAGDSTPVTPSRVPGGFTYRAPWHASPPGHWHDELARECSEQHCLFGVTARVVARRQDCDDFLFELFGSRAPGEFAVVHLVFGSRRESNPAFPGATVFSTFQDWVVRCMQPEADDWDETSPLR